MHHASNIQSVWCDYIAYIQSCKGRTCRTVTNMATRKFLTFSEHVGILYQRPSVSRECDVVGMQQHCQAVCCLSVQGNGGQLQTYCVLYREVTVNARTHTHIHTHTHKITLMRILQFYLSLKNEYFN